jgi:hypothetical protein
VTALQSIEVRDLSPADPSAPITAERIERGQLITPRKVLRTYDEDEWEVFIEEWATGLRPRYVRVQRFGGPGDRGVDVAGFHSADGFEGEWDCYQGKFYAVSLTPSVAWPEMLKVFLLPIRNALYRLPLTYSFIAPLGLSTSLAHLISAPTELKKQFLAQVTGGDSKTFKALVPEEREAVLKLASATDFRMFTSVEVLNLLDQHRETPFYAARFGGGLPPRPKPQGPPTEVHQDELVYVEKLLAAYDERYASIDTVAAAEAHDKAASHFRRQRESFFRAEALKSFARDSVPAHTFEGLQSELYDAVIETAEAEHVDGLERLRQTLDQAVNAQLSANALIQVTEPADRRGICHQLANEDRLTWVSTS